MIPRPSSTRVLFLSLTLVIFLLTLAILWKFQTIGSIHVLSSPPSSSKYSTNTSRSNLSLSTNANYSFLSPLGSPISDEFVPNLSPIGAPAPSVQSWDQCHGYKAAFRRKTDENLRKIEAILARARASIREATLVRNLTSVHHDPDYVPGGPSYRNPNAFHRSYIEMEKTLKIYVYEEGNPPLLHTGPCKNIYTTEGRFINQMVKKNQYFRTINPDQAMVYFLPFSIAQMVKYLYKDDNDRRPIGHLVMDYVTTVATKYPFWNRSSGADHFMVSCHDWGPIASTYVPDLFHKSIRVLCNANTSEGFRPAKDASLPEINLYTGNLEGLVGGPSPSIRPILAFFAGRLHGYIRRLLLREWKGKDEEVQVFEELPRQLSYKSMLRKSKFCLCPSGYEVASPRIVEAIYTGCVPVLISTTYVPPFSDALNWTAFSVHISVKDIPNIKKILKRISTSQYLRMQRRVKRIQRHFIINPIPKRFDFFHMTLHSVWLRRLNVQVLDDDRCLV